MTSVLTFLALLLFGAPAPAQTADTDQWFRRTAPFHGKQIPLPAGDWRIAGSAPGLQASLQDKAGQALPAPVATLVLVQADAGVVTAFVTIHTNTAPARHGWGTATPCRRTDLLAVTLTVGPGGEVSCSFAATVALGAETGPAPSAWQDARDLASRRGWSLPDRWLMAGARIGDHEDFIEIRYHFAPQPPASEPWTSAALAKDPSRAGAIAALVRWRLAMAEAVEAGLKNRLDAGFALPWPDVATGAAQSALAARKQALDSLLAQGRLTPAQYQEQLRLAAAPDSSAADDADHLWMTAAKTVGWRVVVASSVALLSYAFTSSAVIAGGIAGTTAVVNGVLYFGHELFWQKLDPTGAAPMPVIDFVGAGIIG